jgi:hypothetical protein
MEIDEKEYRAFLLQMLKIVREAETHITAYRAFFEEVSKHVPQLAFVLTKAFEGARAETDAKYSSWQERTSAEPLPESLVRDLTRLLARWKPKGPAQ